MSEQTPATHTKPSLVRRGTPEAPGSFPESRASQVGSARGQRQRNESGDHAQASERRYRAEPAGRAQGHGVERSGEEQGAEGQQQGGQWAAGPVQANHTEDQRGQSDGQVIARRGLPPAEAIRGQVLEPVRAERAERYGQSRRERTD